MSAYYSRNNSYSRSLNAEEAEREDRLPRTRAAKHMGLSVAAFDAGCRAAGYVATEWHHVGKYANEVDYYDTRELATNADFWRGAISKIAKCRRAELTTRMNEELAAERADEVDAFRRHIKRGLIVPPVPRHGTADNWRRYVAKKVEAAAGLPGWSVPVPIGDHAALAAAIESAKRGAAIVKIAAEPPAGARFMHNFHFGVDYHTVAKWSKSYAAIILVKRADFVSAFAVPN